MDRGINSPITDTDEENELLERELSLLLSYSSSPADIHKRVIIYDPDAISRAGLAALVEKRVGLSVAALTSSQEEAVEEMIEQQADLLIIREDAGMLLSDRQAAELSRAWPETAITLIAIQLHKQRIIDLRSSGVTGLVFKGDDADELIECLHATAAGQTYTSALVDVQLDAGRQLTPREQEVVVLLAVGYTGDEVAQRLFISPKTVESHRHHVMRKLNLSSRAELFAYARRHCLV